MPNWFYACFNCADVGVSQTGREGEREEEGKESNISQRVSPTFGTEPWLVLI